MACARVAVMLSLSISQVKRLKKRLCEDGEPALAHANRGRGYLIAQGTSSGLGLRR